MSHFVRISTCRFINFADIRDIYIHKDEGGNENDELSVTITWAGVEDSIDTFAGEEAKKIIGMVELLSIDTLNSLNIANPPEEPI
ncbi:hypothetical protein [Microseira sp. BLCC-F43]|jgi:hypothetical protein|uniref:hypothetical protein n=1 Tax=Microseira sp. BLCC-F43 TaxID=3153602 RepID=UPI0035B943F5